MDVHWRRRKGKHVAEDDGKHLKILSGEEAGCLDRSAMLISYIRGKRSA